MLLSYSTIFSRVLGRINDPKELLLSEEDLMALYKERLHNVIGNPRISNVFTTLVLHEIEPEPPTPPDDETDETEPVQPPQTDESSEDEQEDEEEFTEDTIEYELKNANDEYSDNEYVIQLFTTGMVIEWLRPKVDSVLYTAPMIGGKEEKKILDGHKDMIGRLDSLEKQLHKLIRDRGYIHNSYIEEV
jgi:hypothetical protein